MSEHEAVREFAQRNADLFRAQRLGEVPIWDAIAERGQEWTRARKGRGRMKRRQCFRNAALTVLQATNFDATGYQYAEGFALSPMGMWSHHAWLVGPDGVVVDRTWEQVGSRYLGVIIPEEELGTKFELGNSQLVHEPMGFAWAPHMSDKQRDLLFDGLEPDGMGTFRKTDKEKIK